MTEDKEKVKETNQYSGYGTVRPMNHIDSIQKSLGSGKRQRDLEK